MEHQTETPSTAAVAQNGAGGGSAPGEDGGENIQIVIKRTSHRVEIDLDQITWADELRAKHFRDRAKGGDVSEEEGEAFLNDLIQKVTGRDPMTLPRAVAERVVKVIFGEEKRVEAIEGNSETGS